MIVFVLFQATSAFLSAFSVQWLKWWAEDNTEYPNQHLARYLGVYGGLQISGIICFAAATWFMFSYIARRSGIYLHETLLRATLSASLQFFTKTDTGSILLDIGPVLTGSSDG
jgi:hypothetical protein